MHYEASHHSGKLKRNSLWESSGNDPKAYISESSQPRSKRAVVFIPPPLVNSQALPASRGWAKYTIFEKEKVYEAEKEKEGGIDDSILNAEKLQLFTGVSNRGSLVGFLV